MSCRNRISLYMILEQVRQQSNDGLVIYAQIMGINWYNFISYQTILKLVTHEPIHN
ncbi:MAG TPA: hypothetical protein VIY08_10285 [Candidatus Nitrosocosmicus sp.]